MDTYSLCCCVHAAVDKHACINGHVGSVGGTPCVFAVHANTTGRGINDGIIFMRVLPECILMPPNRKHTHTGICSEPRAHKIRTLTHTAREYG